MNYNKEAYRLSLAATKKIVAQECPNLRPREIPDWEQCFREEVRLLNIDESILVRRDETLYGKQIP